MKERMDFMMNALRGRVFSDLDDLDHQTDSPFIVSVTSFPLPSMFHMPQVENYDGSKDPLRSLGVFQDPDAPLRGARRDHVQSLLTTLKGPARIWFNRLTPNSISTFKELSAQLASHFIGGHKYKKSTACLMNIKQREDETLRSYITRFSKKVLLIDEVDDKILVAAFTNGLRKGKFIFSLYKNDPKTILDVFYRATKYMNAEDALLAREEKPKKRKRQEDI